MSSSSCPMRGGGTCFCKRVLWVCRKTDNVGCVYIWHITHDTIAFEFITFNAKLNNSELKNKLQLYNMQSSINSQHFKNPCIF